MNRLNILISLFLVIIIILVVFATFESDVTTKGILISVVAIIVGLEIYLFSIKNDKRSMMITMILLDERKRRIVEFLATPHSIDDIVSKLKIDSATSTDLITILEKKGFVKSKSENNKVLYFRTF